MECASIVDNPMCKYHCFKIHQINQLLKIIELFSNLILYLLQKSNGLYNFLCMISISFIHSYKEGLVNQLL